MPIDFFVCSGYLNYSNFCNNNKGCKIIYLWICIIDSDSDESVIDYNETPDEEVDDELVKSIRDAKNSERDFPPLLRILEGINDICLNPSDDTLAVALSSGDVDVYSYSIEHGNKLVNKFELHTEACRDVEFNEDGRILFSASAVSYNL